jgi:hypothetical protein
MRQTSLSGRPLGSPLPLCCVTIGILLLPAVPPGAAADEPPASPLAGLHARVERAFARCDAGLLRPVLSRKIKTFVAAGALTETDGYYGADQLVILFERLFEGRTTLRVEALSPDPKPRRDGSASLPIRWISSGRSGSRSEIALAFILTMEGQDWQIREIRDLK